MIRAGKRTAGGEIALRLRLPSRYSFDHDYFTQDLRISSTFPLRSERLRIVLLGEVFNVFNYANVTGYSGNLANAAIFGQPAARYDQVLGSGGPRTFQFAA